MACVRCVRVCRVGGSQGQFNIFDYKKVWRFDKTQQAFACSKSTIEKLENGVK